MRLPAKLKFLFIIFEILYFPLFFVVLPSLVIKTRPGVANLSADTQVNITSNTVYTQSFVANHDNLNSISVFLKNPGLVNRQNFTLDLLSSDNTVLQTLNFSGFGVGDPSWLTFQFPSISQSRRTTYTIRLSTSESSSIPLSLYKDSITGNYEYKTTYLSGNFIASLQDNLQFQSSQLSHRNLIFSAFYFFLLITLNFALFKKV